MRVIGGKARGKSLRAPRGMNTRPITAMIKEALFNVVGPDVAESRWLDLFAGSGAVGIEALSRGASQAVFIDADKSAVDIIRDNLRHCGLEKEAEVYRNDVFKATRLLQKRSQHFDYVYIDPPFTNEAIFIPILKDLASSRLLEEDGILILRTPHRFRVPASIEGVACNRSDRYGESALHYYGYIKEGSADDGSVQDSGRY
ncbi:MAG: 16S rRNA (guanine(966)-N(2))-methyltransferase RsmD [Deltaproteobacteria bacterium]